VAEDGTQQTDEIGRLIAADPNANLVEGEAQAWLLTGKALDVAKAAVGRRGSGDSRPVEQDADEVGPPQPLADEALAEEELGSGQA
jgi:hypothetical protein